MWPCHDIYLIVLVHAQLDPTSHMKVRSLFFFMMMSPIVQLSKCGQSRHRLMALQHQNPILCFIKCLVFLLWCLVDYRWFTCSRLLLSSWVWGMENMMMNISIKIIDLGRLFVGDMMITKFYLSIKSFSRNIQDADDFWDVIFKSIVLLIVSWWKKFFEFHDSWFLSFLHNREHKGIVRGRLRNLYLYSWGQFVNGSSYQEKWALHKTLARKYYYRVAFCPCATNREL